MTPGEIARFVLAHVLERARTLTAFLPRESPVSLIVVLVLAVILLALYAYAGVTFS